MKELEPYSKEFWKKVDIDKIKITPEQKFPNKIDYVMLAVLVGGIAIRLGAGYGKRN